MEGLLEKTVYTLGQQCCTVLDLVIVTYLVAHSWAEAVNTVRTLQTILGQHRADYQYFGHRFTPTGYYWPETAQSDYCP